MADDASEARVYDSMLCNVTVVKFQIQVLVYSWYTNLTITACYPPPLL